jgi:hypothetical protein
MKLSLALGPRAPLSPQTAWGCLTSNLAMPGAGSLVAGRASGYAQLLLAGGGTVLTLVFGIRFALWYIAYVSQVSSFEGDPTAYYAPIWLAMRWALLGMGLFLIGWFWSLATGLAILRDAKRTAARRVPPRLT